MASIGEDLRRFGVPAKRNESTGVHGSIAGGSSPAHELEALHSLMSRVARGDLDDETRPWLAAAFRVYIESGGAVPLDQALGLRPAQSERLWIERLNQQRRDLALAGAVEALLGNPAESMWKGCGRLAEELLDFERVFWPQWCELACAPTGTSALRTALFEFFRAGGVPIRQRAIHYAVQRARGSCCGER